MSDTPDHEIAMVCGRLDALVREALQDITALSDELGEGDDVGRHLVNRLLIATDYATGCMVLGRSGLGAPLAIISRTLFEGFIGVYWATLTDDNGRRALEAAKREMLRVMRLNLKQGRAQVVHKETGADHTDEVLRHPIMGTAERLPRFDHMADAAGVRRIYDQLYGMLSLLSHASGTEILANRDQKELILGSLHSSVADLRCIHLIVCENIRKKRVVPVDELEAIMKVALA